MEKISETGHWVYDSARRSVQSWKFPWKLETETPFRLSVVTGDRRGAGTDANVYIIIRDSSGNVSRKIKPSHAFKDDHERGSVTHFDFGPNEGVEAPFEEIEIWRDNFGGINLLPALNQLLFGGATKDSSDWFLDRVDISVKVDPKGDNCALLSTCSFPVHRWISDKLHYVINRYDCRLPQHDPERKQFRLDELQIKRKSYVYSEKVKGGPVMVQDLPSDENFSENFFWTFVDKRTSLMTSKTIIDWTTPRWKTFDGLIEIYKLGFERPNAVNFWKEDWWFALQRVQGVDPTIIKLCEGIPDNLQVPDCITDLLEGYSLAEALARKKIFICNLSILEGINCKDGRELAAPIALFYLNKKDELVPITIQLRQGHSEINPVYTPLDPPNTWLVAKMFYNNAEAQYHQSLTHLGLTHLLMEGVCVAVHRCLSVSHPLFRLMAPHFLYLIAINKRGEEKLINPDGWVDVTMTQGIEGMFQLMAKGFKCWTFKNTDPKFEIEARGLIDPKILPYYPYRDDAISLYQIIKNYVSKVVTNYYDSPATVQSDWELNRFWKELTATPPCGLGLIGIPGNRSKVDGGFTRPEEIIETVTGIISTCSLGHAAANSQQYKQYAFIPNYPGMLNEDPPKEKKNCYSEEDLISLLPSKEATLNTVVITNLLSSPITNRLGDFEVQYLFHPEDVKAAQTFRNELKDLSLELRRRNESRRCSYNDLDPALVPNSISI